MYTFNVEVTDTFGGGQFCQAHFSWVERYTYEAKSFRGAIQKLAREHGAGWRKEIECGDYAQYKLRGACVVAFVTIETGY